MVVSLQMVVNNDNIDLSKLNTIIIEGASRFQLDQWINAVNRDMRFRNTELHEAIQKRIFEFIEKDEYKFVMHQSLIFYRKKFDKRMIGTIYRGKNHIYYEYGDPITLDEEKIIKEFCHDMCVGYKNFEDIPCDFVSQVLENIRDN